MEKVESLSLPWITSDHVQTSSTIGNAISVSHVMGCRLHPIISMIIIVAVPARNGSFPWVIGRTVVHLFFRISLPPGRFQGSKLNHKDQAHIALMKDTNCGTIDNVNKNIK